MESVYTSVDPTGSFCANIISKKGRNEVQIFPIDKTSSENIIVNALIKKFELSSDDRIRDVTWVSAERTSKSDSKRGTKRSKSEEKIDTNDTNESINLIILIESGDLLVFSPFKDEVVERISNETKLKALTGSLKQQSIVGIKEDNELLEINLSNNKTKTYKFKKSGEDIQTLKSIKYKGNGSTSKSQYILLGSQNLFLIDTSRSKKSLVSEFPKFEELKRIKNIQQSKIQNDIVFVSRDDCDLIYLYNLSTPESYSTFKTSSSKIFNIQTIASNEAEALMALTEDGIEIFNIDFETQHLEQKPIGLIKTDFHDSDASILFKNLFTKANEQLIGIWHDRNQPHFSIIDWLLKDIGERIIAIDYSEINDLEIDNNEDDQPNILLPDQVEVVNISFNELSKQLSGLLIERNSNTEEIIKLCESNNDETNIKETIRSFATLPNSSLLTNNLFDILSHKISKDFTTKSSLSIWLKWLLTVQGGFISKQAEQHGNLKSLQSGLEKGMKLLPRLLALQGRLQLLKSQADLRSNMHIDDDDDDENQDDENQTFNESFANQTTLAEESIVYANGENDDFEENETFDAGDAELVEEEEEEDDQ
ncbi:hypothetical protein HYPBUDRAFT_242297 [Hyphopichia burtonii NRRL Y-1933]|uniref:Small-subunit processome Utp12 domain-containing protein n=1 Tax=Hyphopichia burtonii NRRL Y-1933 TaxID=984485 RepID=A0A1E4RHI4_9ASCO|nr:hypothetical protein HYPBUDRAFT_242297 [Hyphopichia burtonii NRRL Y-1933]ODV66681.1 hypothetical protein HYPBUDRAFT_242297 [Hyphopichia burtonii NRRL Y-1933]